MPQTTEDILRAIESDNITITSDMLWDIINTHNTGDGQIQKKMYGRYKQSTEAVPVFDKFYYNWEGKVTARIPNDFFGDVVDVATGYMGNAITIELDKEMVTSESEQQRQEEFLRQFSRRESTTDENSELLKMAKAAGKGYRLLFADEDAQARIINLDPWETIVFYDGSMRRPQAAMRFWQVEERRTGADIQSPGRRSSYDKHTRPNMRYRVEWYDEEYITFYRETNAGVFIPDTSQPKPPAATAGTGRQPHFFNGVPIIEFKNNEEGLAEPAKAVRLIDAYDDIMSDATSEVEQLRMAYMFVKGAGLKLDPELELSLQQTGIWPLPADGEIGFAGKDLSGASEFIQYVLTELRKNIYSFSKSIDLSKDYGGDMRVIGWQIAILRMEMSSQVTERKFKKSYLRQYQLLSDYWQGVPGAPNIDPYSLVFTFTRKFPRDVAQEVDTLLKAQQALPLEEAYALMSFIDNPSEMAERYKEERPEMQSLLEGIDDAESQVE